MAEIKPSYDTKRKKLSETVPLGAPLSMYIEPTRLCNFKCFYCMHGTRGISGGPLDQTGFSLKNMDMGLFDKLAGDIMGFREIPKRICFSGLGEPLMNRDLPLMVKKLRDAGFKNRIDIITNGLLLTPEMSDALIHAGISRVQVSIQGLTNEKYRETCQADIAPQDIIRNIRYFYGHGDKAGTTIFVKIIDAILEGGDRERFFGMFGSICDTIYVEHLVVMQQQMGDHGGIVDSTRNLNGELVGKRDVCGVMFYFMQVNTDGETFPCSTPGLLNSFSLGNAHRHTLQEIWDGDPRNRLIRRNLTDGYAKIPACSKCSSCIAIADDTEYLDDCREEILARFPDRRG